MIDFDSICVRYPNVHPHLSVILDLFSMLSSLNLINSKVSLILVSYANSIPSAIHSLCMLS